MTLLEKLKSLFGVGGDGSTRPSGNDGVTVESDASRTSGREAPPPMSSRDREEPAAESRDEVDDRGETTDISIDEPTDESADSQSDADATDDGSDETDDESDGMPIEEAEPADEGAAAGSDAGGSTETISRVPDEDDGAAEQGEAVEPDETDAAPTAEKTSDDDPEPTDVESEPVTEIKGIGAAYGDRLAEAGVDSTLALAESDADELAEETDISPSRIQDWIDRANDR